MTERNIGERPTFFDDPAIDQLMAIIMSMSAELSVLYDRVDSLEQLLAEKDVVRLGEVESYRPGEAVEAQRKARREDYLKRLFRIVREDAAQLVPHDQMERYRALQDELARD